MVVGGYFYDGVEVVSPDGNCSLSLAQFPYGTIHLGAGAAMAPGMSSNFRLPLDDRHLVHSQGHLVSKAVQAMFSHLRRDPPGVRRVRRDPCGLLVLGQVLSLHTRGR